MVPIVLCLVALIVLYFWGLAKRPKNFPPGPPGLPLIGALPLLGKYPYRSLTKLKVKYGPIVGFDSIAGVRAIGISDYKLLKAAASELTFAGRPKVQFMADRSGGTPEGIVFTEGRKWQEQRRFALRRLRDFGFGTRSMEAIVQDEIQELIERLKQDVGKPISMQNRFNGAVINALWTIVAGERFRQDDPKVNEIFRLFTQDLSAVDFRAILSIFIPAIAKYCPDWVSGSSKLAGPVDAVQALIRTQIDSHMKSHVAGQPRDFIDTYIDEIEATSDPDSSFHADKLMSFIFTIVDLFMAGGETTSTTLTWIFLFMARHPHIQEKMGQEIERVVGNSRLPSLTDRPSMPYTEAVIHEVLRVCPLFPVTMQCTMEDVTNFQGFHIPKDTTIFLNLYDANYDPELWGDPENFRPDRFLNQDESRFVYHEGLCTFSLGKRVCLGERLARDQLFLFTAALFQAFQVGTDKNGPPPSLESNSIGLMMPSPHKLVLTIK